MSYWRVRDRRTALFSTGGIDAEFDTDGRDFSARVGAKGSLFHYVYGFAVDRDGKRRFHQRRECDSIDDFDAVRFDACGAEVQVVPGRSMFTRNQLLNKDARTLDGLAPAELAAENRKQF